MLLFVLLEYIGRLNMLTFDNNLGDSRWLLATGDYTQSNLQCVLATVELALPTDMSCASYLIWKDPIPFYTNHASPKDAIF